MSTCFEIACRVALMISQVRQDGSRAVGLLLIPDADVMNVGAGNEQELCADGLIPVSHCA